MRWHVLYWMCGVALLVGGGSSAQAEAPLPSAIQKMLKEGHRLTQANQKITRVRGAYMLLKAYESAPIRFETLVGVCRATNQLAFEASDNKEIQRWAKKGWEHAKMLISRWPDRAEGYFWSAINIGQYARGGGVWVAMTQGLAGKIEKMAQESIKRSPSLYHGGAQRILGRFYYKLPWPMRNLQKSLGYLQTSYRLAPKNPAALLFLADTLWDLGKKAQARNFYQGCAALWQSDMEPQATPRTCQKRLQERR